MLIKWVMFVAGLMCDHLHHFGSVPRPVSPWDILISGGGPSPGRTSSRTRLVQILAWLLPSCYLGSGKHFRHLPLCLCLSRAHRLAWGPRGDAVRDVYDAVAVPGNYRGGGGGQTGADCWILGCCLSHFPVA